jgi:tetratricopeptide (TPR) repeat protein
LLLTMTAGPAAAQSTRLKNIQLCNGSDRTSPEPQIKGCTALIVSDTEPPRILTVAHNNRGNAYVARGDYDRAIEDYNQAIKISPSYARAFNNRAVAFGKKGQHERAVEDLDAALKLEPGYAGAFTNRAETHAKTSRYDLAIQDYEAAIRIHPTMAAWTGRCRTRAILGDLRPALADCAESLRLGPNAGAFEARGLAYLKLGEWKSAISDFDAALRLDARHAAALYGRSIAYAKDGMADRADIDGAAAKAIDPNIAEEFARYGVN